MTDATDTIIPTNLNVLQHFQDVIKNGYIPQIEYYIDVLGADIHAPRLLSTAIKEQNTLVVKYLIEKGVDNIKDDKNQILADAIHYTRDLEIVKYLVSVGASVNTMVFSDHYNNEMVKYLSSIHEVRRLSRKTTTPLYEAVRIKNLEMVKYLVSVGANVNLGSITPIRMAVTTENLEMVKYLVSVGADVINIHINPLHDAIEIRNLEMVKYLVSVGADVNSNKTSLYTLLDEAIITGNIEIVLFLKENGAKRSWCSIL